MTSPATDNSVSLAITTQNLNPTGPATLGSHVSMHDVGGYSTATIQVSGTYTGALSAQVTTDLVNWVTVGGTPFLNINTGASSATIPSGATGIYQASVAGFARFRVTALAAVTGTATVTINLSAGSDSTATLTTAGAVSVDLNDGTGAAVNSLSAGAGKNSLLVAIGPTNFVTSAANSTTAQLAASATFTGTIETAFNEIAASVLLTCDQPCTLTINQYIDAAGTFKTGSIVRTLAANQGLQESFDLNGNYVNFVLQNTGVSTTTTLNLNVAYGNIDSVESQGSKRVVMAAGSTIFARIASSASSGNPAFLKSGPGLVSLFWGLTGANPVFLQFYNKASAPVIGTDTPILTYPIPANTYFNQQIANGGAAFSTGVAYAFTTDAAAATGSAAAAVLAFALFGA